IGLFAHRLASTEPTGVDRYFRELVRALARTAAGQRLILASIPEPEYADWIPVGVDRHVIPWPRRAVQLAWSLGAGPRLERSLGPSRGGGTAWRQRRVLHRHYRIGGGRRVPPVRGLPGPLRRLRGRGLDAQELDRPGARGGAARTGGTPPGHDRFRLARRK